MSTSRNVTSTFGVTKQAGYPWADLGTGAGSGLPPGARDPRFVAAEKLCVDDGPCA